MRISNYLTRNYRINLNDFLIAFIVPLLGATIFSMVGLLIYLSTRNQNIALILALVSSAILVISIHYIMYKYDYSFKKMHRESQLKREKAEITSLAVQNYMSTFRSISQESPIRLLLLKVEAKENKTSKKEIVLMAYEFAELMKMMELKWDLITKLEEFNANEVIKAAYAIGVFDDFFKLMKSMALPEELSKWELKTPYINKAISMAYSIASFSSVFYVKEISKRNILRIILFCVISLLMTFLIIGLVLKRIELVIGLIPLIVLSIILGVILARIIRDVSWQGIIIKAFNEKN
jgi:hypothetical protein